MAEIKTVDEKNFASTIASGNVLIDFWAPWCSYCRIVGTVIDQSINSMPENLIIGKVNVDDNAELAAKYNITTLPTLILFKDGKEISRHGTVSKAELLRITADL
ncbi:MAG: thiol reductase thioredoxin [Lentisphaerae bacterium]|nr:thiol reductase thioredoxin [Lentisphaerota bacterium]